MGRIDTNMAYDALDRPSSVTRNYCPSGNTNPNCSGSGVLSDQNLASTFAYDLAGNQTQVVNARGIMSFTAFDALHRAIAVTADCQTVPAPPSTSCGTQSSDQNVLSSQSYDQSGHVLSTSDPLNRVNVFAYDVLGRKITETINCVGTNCNGGVTSGQNLTTQWQYDAQSNLLKTTSPRQCTTTAPCFNGSSITDGAYLATGYSYDGLLRLASVVEDKNHSGPTTSYTYDPAGHMLSQTDGLGHATTYTIDNLGRTTKVTDAGSNVVQTTYSPAGEVVSTLNARNKTNSYTLDSAGRLTGVSYFSSSSAPLSQSFAYDADGNRTCFSSGNCQTGDTSRTMVTYDHLNRVGSVTAPSPLGTTSYAYFLDGAVNTITDANGTTTFTEDRLARTSTMVDPLTAGTTSYGYDAVGRLTSRTEANGIVTTTTYSGADRLTSKTEVAGATTLASWTNIGYDLAENRTA
jgi:YD repeat-containing protein